MKFKTILALLLLFCLLLPSCASTLTDLPEQTEVTEEKTTEESKKTEEKEDTTNEEKKSEEKKEPSKQPIMQTADPADDNEFNILMIGNSFSYFFVEELYGIAKAEGLDFTICNLYYSGCSVKTHWEWLQEDNYGYDLYTTDGSGRRGKSASMKSALKEKNWDVITLQQASSKPNQLDFNAQMKNTSSYAKNILNYLKEQFPQSKLYWHQTWAYEVGYNRSNGSIPNVETQNLQHKISKDSSIAIAKENDIPLIPSGDAWALARKEPLVGDTLCVGTEKNDGLGDHYHDGNTGGGQYLNACVWFEVLTGKTCIGNTWRPDYDLKEEKIPVLQKAAHKAIADVYGSDFAK